MKRTRRSENREVKCQVQKGREQHISFVVDRSLGVVHHLSYVRVDKDLRRKMGTFSHAGEEEVHAQIAQDRAVLCHAVRARHLKPDRLPPGRGSGCLRHMHMPFNYLM